MITPLQIILVVAWITCAVIVFIITVESQKPATRAELLESVLIGLLTGFLGAICLLAVWLVENYLAHLEWWKKEAFPKKKEIR